MQRFNRLMSLKSELVKNRKLYDEYVNFMQIMMSDFIEQLPEFLHLSSVDWPSNPLDRLISHDPEVKKAFSTDSD